MARKERGTYGGRGGLVGGGGRGGFWEAREAPDRRLGSGFPLNFQYFQDFQACWEDTGRP